MGKDKDYITVEITIEQAVKALVRSFNETEETVIIAMANHILITDFDMFYEEYEVTIPDQESVHVECYIPGGMIIKYLIDVAENGWGSVYADPKFCEIITKTKDKNGRVIVPMEKIETIDHGTRKVIKTIYKGKAIRAPKVVVERYTEEPIPFRKFKAKIDLFKELREQNNMPIPEYWVDDNSEETQEKDDGGDNNKQQSTIKDENDCQRWLEDLMKNKKSKVKTKGGYREEAKKKFKVGKNSFNRAWYNAIRSTKNYEWSKGGRPKKEK